MEDIVGGHDGCRGLTPQGRLQAEALRDRLLATGELSGAGCLCCSILPRAVETAAIIAPGVGRGDLLVEQDCGLCEVHWGEGDGLTWTDFKHRYGFTEDPTHPFSPGGESWETFLARARPALRALVDRPDVQEVVAVTHAGVIDASLVEFAGIETPGRSFDADYTGMTVWRHVERGWRLSRYNDTAHLSHHRGGATRLV